MQPTRVPALRVRRHEVGLQRLPVVIYCLAHARLVDDTGISSDAMTNNRDRAVVATNRFTETAHIERTPLLPQHSAAVWSMFELMVKPAKRK
jgi:hypothetical protein